MIVSKVSEVDWSVITKLLLSFGRGHEVQDTGESPAQRTWGFKSLTVSDDGIVASKRLFFRPLQFRSSLDRITPWSADEWRAFGMLFWSSFISSVRAVRYGY